MPILRRGLLLALLASWAALGDGFSRAAVESKPETLQVTPYSAFQEFVHTATTGFGRGSVEAGSSFATRFGISSPLFSGPLIYYGAAGANLVPGLVEGKSHISPGVISVGDDEAQDLAIGTRQAVESPPYGINTYTKSQEKASTKVPLSHKVVCYYSSWAAERPKPMNFDHRDIDGDLCTHIIYAFALIDEEDLSVKVSEKQREDFKSLVGLKERWGHLNVLLGIGGWKVSSGTFSKVAETDESRNKFANNVLDLVKEFKFDGVNIDWLFPGNEETGGRAMDKENFGLLLKTVHDALEATDATVSAAVPAGKHLMESGFSDKDKRISNSVDFLSVMAYDLRGHWDGFVDIHAPLYERDEEMKGYDEYNAHEAIKYWQNEVGISKHKLVLGVPAYGRSYELEDSTKTGMYNKSSGPGYPGVYTQDPGFLSYFEICDLYSNLTHNFKADFDDKFNIYITNGTTWVGFDYTGSVLAKMLYVRNKGLGGAMIWTIDLDDYRGTCGNMYPLLRTMDRILKPFEFTEDSDEAIVAEVDPDNPAKDPNEQEEEEVEDYDDDYPVIVEVEFNCPATISKPITSEDIPESDRATIVEAHSPSSSLHPSPFACNEFYMCDSAGNASPMECSEGLHFNPSTDTCDWPDNVGCNAAEKEENKQKAVAKKPKKRGRSFFYSLQRPQPYYVLTPGQMYTAHIPYVLHHPNVHSPQLRSQASSKNVLCYFTNWATHREDKAKFVPENVDASLCSHVIYAYASLNRKSLRMEEAAPKYDVKSAFYSRLQNTARKSNPSVKILLGLGGWTDSEDDAYSKLAASSDEEIADFAVAAAQFVSTRGFDGLSLEWQYPVCRQSDCSKGLASDKAGYTKIVRALNASLSSAGMTLAASISGYKPILEKGYDLEAVARELALINVMTYDYHGFWDGKTAHHSPLYPDAATASPNLEFTTDETVAYIVSQNVDPSKVHIGIPLFGQSYSLVGNRNDYGAPTEGRGSPGKYTRQGGMLAYYEICHGVEHYDWTKVPATAIRGPYAYNRNQWVSYDDPEMAKMKSMYAVEKGLGGVSLWTIDLDDFNNMCCHGPNPVMNAVSMVLRGVGSQPSPGNCASPAPVSTPAPIKEETTTWDSGSVDSTTSTTWAPPPSSTTATTTTTTMASTGDTTNDEGSTGEAGIEGSACSGQFRDDPSNCAVFYQCASGIWVKQICGPGLLYDKSAKLCNHKNLVSCGTRSIPSGFDDSNAVDAVDNDAAAAVITEGDSAECTTGEYAPVLGDCGAYISCVEGKKYLQRCASGLHWVNSRSTCDWPENSECMDAATRLYQQTLQALTRYDDCVTGQYYPNEQDCSGFYLCSNHEKVPFTCSSGVWNQEKLTCDHAREGGGCVSQFQGAEQIITPATPTSTPAATTPTAAPARPAEPPQEVVISPNAPSGDYKIVCYFTNWAWYRPGIGKYKPEDIDEDLCTHIVYGFAVLDYSSTKIKIHDRWADLDNDFYKKVTALKQKGKKVTIAIGGWNDSAGPKYSTLVNSPANRKAFIEDVIAFIDEHNFDGLDLDWEYPKCWQVDCSKGPDSDKTAFTAWVNELRTAFDNHQPRLLLSAAVSPSKTVIQAGYEVKALSDALDWIAVMSYDYHGHWDKKTGHVAPMYAHPEDDFSYFNTNFTIHYYIEQGADPRKLVMGMPMYGQAFTLNSESNNGLNAPANSKGKAGDFTRAAGFLAYYEICHHLYKESGWTKVESPNHIMGPYIHKGNQWVGYDDVDMIRYKSEYIRKMGLGGGMIWALDLDDFNNRCGQGPHPLLNTIKNVLGPAFGEYEGQMMITTDDASMPEKDVQEEVVHEDVMDKEEEEESMGTTSDETAEEDDNVNEVMTSDSEDDDGYKVVCYFTNWAWYRQGDGKYQPEDIDASLCTHIVYGFAVLDSSTLVLKPHDSWADLDNKFYEKVTALKSAKKKVLLAIGGWNDSAGNKYSRLVNNPASRKAFVEHAVGFLEEHNFDGLDLDWEYPKCWQVDCSKGPDSDKEAFSAWIKELKEAFQAHPKKFLLTAATSPSKTVVDAGYDIPAMDKYLDYVSVMTYDYHGQWDKETGHVAPLYDHPSNSQPFFNVNSTVHVYLERGLSPKKLILGMPMYGQSFTLAEAKNNGWDSKTYGGGEAGEFTRARGFLAYYEICDFVKNRGWTVVRDPEARTGPYATKGDQWVGFDDVDNIQEKSEYVIQKGLGGAMIWALDLDDFRNRCHCEAHPLLKTINRALGLRKDQAPNCKLNGVFGTGYPDTPKKKNNVISVPRDATSIVEGQSCTEEGRYEVQPTNCHQYFRCISQVWQLEHCPSNLAWNNEIGNCDWEDNVPSCQESTQEFSNEISDVSVVDIVVTEIEQDPDEVSSPSEIAEETSDGASETDTAHEVQPIDTSGMKVVCYFTNWAWYRKGAGKYTPEHIDPQLCTHINYGFAILDHNQLLLKPHDTWADIENEFYKKVTDFKKLGIKVLIALGGWNDSETDKYSRLVSDPIKRKKFIEHVVDFIQEHNFDGLDLDWEYPACPQVNCDRGNPNDKANFAAFVRELKQAFKKDWLLTAAVSPSIWVLDQAYDVPVLNQYLDFINVMTYDYHGKWDRKTGHVAPLYDYIESSDGRLNAEQTLLAWVERGASKKKLIMGMPMYGQSFTLDNPSNKELNSPASRGGSKGKYTGAEGFLAYNEICELVRSGAWTSKQYPEKPRPMGPIAFSGNQWVGYDDPAMIRQKSEFVKANGYGGGMIWALDLDDFNGVCGCGKYPLLRTINAVLRQNVPDRKCDAGVYKASVYSLPHAREDLSPFDFWHSLFKGLSSLAYKQHHSRLDAQPVYHYSSIYPQPVATTYQVKKSEAPAAKSEKKGTPYYYLESSRPGQYSYHVPLRHY